VQSSEEPRQHVARSPLEEGLHEAEADTLAELDLVIASLRRAVEAATSDREILADEVLAQARESEQRYAEVHDCLLGLIARQAPVAGDLRLAMALLHINDRVERMSAQCVNIATLCRAIPDGRSPSARQLECLSAMATLADEQVLEAKRALAERDVERAVSLREHDVGINEHNRRCFALAIDDGVDEGAREAAFFVALMARAIERIGDNAVDIGQQTIFAVTGRLRAGTGS
jgi:phosphate transport system protein